MPVHDSLKNIRLWADVDIMDSPVRNQVKEIIDNDLPKDSPQILEELDGKRMTNQQLFEGSTRILLESAIFTCPNQVPEKMKKEYKKTLENIEKQIKNNEQKKKNN